MNHTTGMAEVLAHIERHQVLFAQHPFFSRLPSAGLPAVRGFVAVLPFWVMAFQDLLRINHALMVDPALRRLAQDHLTEDAGHERWFLHDYSSLGLPQCDLERVFDRSSERVRDATYALVAEVYRSADDRLRVVLLIALEGVGHVFFERVVDRMECLDQGHRLRYFARSHLHVETAHDLHTGSSRATLEALALPEALQRDARALVDRTFVAFGSMMTCLCETAEVA